MDQRVNEPFYAVTVGPSGKPLSKQHGALVHLVVPWKNGYKSIKSIVTIEFINKQPTIRIRFCVAAAD